MLVAVFFRQETEAPVLAVLVVVQTTTRATSVRANLENKRGVTATPHTISFVNVVWMKGMRSMALHKPEHKKVWWWLAWPFMSLGFVLFLPYGLITGREPMESKPDKMQWKSEWYQAWEDYIDDPIDWLKYKLFGIGTLP